MTQSALSKLLDVPLPTLKAHEISERGSTKGLSLPVIQKIRIITGAIWDPKKKSWVTWNPDPEGEGFVPFTRATYEHHRLMLATWTVSPKASRGILKAWVDLLFNQIPPDQCLNLFLRFHAFIDSCRSDFGIGAAEEFLKAVPGGLGELVTGVRPE